MYYLVIRKIIIAVSNYENDETPFIVEVKKTGIKVA